MLLQSATDFLTESVNQSSKAATLKNMQDKLVAAGGELLEEFTAENKTDRWWSTTEVGDTENSNKQTWVIELKTNGQVKVLGRDKIGANASIRPILAF